MADMESLTDDVAQVFAAEGGAATGAVLEGLAAFFTEQRAGLERLSAQVFGNGLDELSSHLDEMASSIGVAADIAAAAIITSR